MTRTSIALSLFLLASITCSTTPNTARPGATTADVDGGDWRATQPTAGPEPQLQAPVPTREILNNGLTVLWVNKNKLPLVSLTVLIRAGSASDPKDRAGLASMVGEMLRSGTKSRTADQINDEIETLGTGLHVSADQDTLELSLTTLTGNLPAALDVIADLLQNPTFPAAELERVRRKQLATLTRMLDDPRTVAGNIFAKAVFGDHPYGHTSLGNHAAVQAMSRKDVVGFYRRNIVPGNTAIIFVGDIDTEAASRATKHALGAWSTPGAGTSPPPSPITQPAQVTLVHKADAPQSQLAVGQLGISRAHPDYFALLLCNAILGGEFTSRINMNLREDKGYTYGAYSSLQLLRGAGTFAVVTGVETTATSAAVAEILKEIAAIREADVSADELEDAKHKYTLSLPGYFQTVQTIAAMVANIYAHDLPLDYYQQVPEKIAAVNVADIRRVAQEHLQPQTLSVVVVGDKSKVVEGLKNLERGTIVELDANGSPLDN